MVFNYVKELLYEHDCVIIPSLGGLLADYQGADVHDLKNALRPPSKRLAFNESLQRNDGLLVDAVAQGEQLSREEALAKINEFVEKFRETLNQDGEFLVEGIGKFLLSEEQTLLFEPEIRENFLEDSFALPELFFKPIERDQEDMKRIRPVQPRPVVRRPTAAKPASETPSNPESAPQPKKEPVAQEQGEEQPKKGKKKTLFLVIPAVIFLLAGGLTFMYMNKQKHGGDDHLVEDNQVVADSEASMIPTSGANEEAETAKDDDFANEAAAGEQTAVVHEEAAPAVNSSKDFHIIVGSFARRSMAEREIGKMGSGEIVEGEGRYRVSVSSYGTWNEALKELQGYRLRYGSGVWILRNK